VFAWLTSPACAAWLTNVLMQCVLCCRLRMPNNQREISQWLAYNRRPCNVSYNVGGAVAGWLAK